MIYIKDLGLDHWEYILDEYVHHINFLNSEKRMIENDKQ